MIQYYYLKDIKRIGKRDKEIYYLLDKEKGWILDEEKKIIDRLIGFDSTKTEDPKSRIGNMEIISQIEEIDAEEVIERLTSREN
ncbi:hypothetical protein ACTQ46_03050 [Gallicola sp. Sow4_E12]|uniref:hypothetical protein n=1 Tax=Gallicola sp. Sow4_E12 TaxID=3438785 RepID=UPI003F8DBE33